MSCSYCQGVGSTETSQRVGSGDWAHWVTVRQTCGICGGSGREPSVFVQPSPPPDQRPLWEQAIERIERGHP